MNPIIAPTKPKRQWGMFLAGMMWGGALMFIVIMLWLRASVILEQPCDLPFDKAKTILYQSAEHASMWEARPVPCGLPMTADSSRIEMIQFCNVKYLPMVLNDPKLRAAAAFMPCRVALYERDGKTYLARVNLNFLAAFLGKSGQRLITTQITPEFQALLEPVLAE